MSRTSVVLAAVAVALGVTAAAAPLPPAPQGPAAPPAGQVVTGAPQGGAARNPAAVSNEVAKVDIDRFVGNPTEAPVHLANGGLLIHAILKAGNPYTPGDQRAVLEYRKQLASATLSPRNRTPLMPLPDQYLFYVTGGKGRLDDGKQFWDLSENVAVLIPPGVPRRFTNTGDDPLQMVMLAWEPVAGTTRGDILVRDVTALQYCEENAHWNNMSKCIFRQADGLLQRERMYLVTLDPWAMSEPHTHGAGTEEIWVKLGPGPGIILLGSELREIPQHGAYLAPPTGVTQHANLNLSRGVRDAYLYIARGPAPASGAAAAPARGGGGGGGRGANPNLFGDQATTELATVAGRPLP